MSRRSSTQTAVEEGRRSTTSSPLAQDYLRWLIPQIRGERDGNPGRSYDDLLGIMFEKEFVWLVPNDHNRIGDGLDLRVEFCHLYLADAHATELGGFLGKTNPQPPCSFLEVLIGLSRRLAFTAGGSANGWAWELMTNLTLHRLGDPVGRSRARRADEIMEQCIWRNYAPNGTGGFFPLNYSAENQVQVELWYQMAAYINENHLERG